jgi:hypothetical protein
MNDLEGDSRPDATSSGVKAAAKPAATGNVPYQWVQRRLFLGRRHRVPARLQTRVRG